MKHLSNYITEALIKHHIDVNTGCVDLNLPSGTLWCNCNLGATKPEEFGEYYMWGDVYPLNATNNTYIHRKDEHFTKYNDKDNKTELDDNNDAAYVDSNGKYRMPTATQVIELVSNTYQKIGKYKGVNGCKYISKIDNKKYIFIPAAGMKDSTRGITGKNQVAHMWSSTLSNNTPYDDKYNYADNLFFNTTKSFIFSNPRANGFTIRPVLNTKN